MTDPFQKLSAAEEKAANANVKPENAARKTQTSKKIIAEAVTDHPLLDAYLEVTRGISKPQDGWPSGVSLHTALPYSFESGISYPALLMAKVMPDQSVCGLHAVFLSSDGRKANVETPKKSFGSGGVVFIRETGAAIVACEGPEDAITLAVALPECAVICTAGAGTLSRVADFSSKYERVILVRDTDEAGENGAKKAAQVILQRGGEVLIATPPEGVKDTNMLLQRGGFDAVRAMIKKAQLVVDPLDGLVDRASADPGEAFKPDVIEALLHLRRENRAAFISLRSKLKRAHVPITELDKAMREENGDDDGERDPTQADILVELAGSTELFHTPNETAYADVMVNEHCETWAVRSKGFKRWLIKRYHDETGSAPNSEALNAALNVIEAKAHYNAPERDVFTRVAGHEGKIYIDLCNEKWEAVEISESGWRVVNDQPVRFRRASGMLPLAIPQKGGSIQALRRFLNVKDDGAFVLAVSWLLAALRSTGPYPVLCLSGEQGSAKSTFMNILRRLIDPNTAPLRTLPREDRDLFIAANNGYVLAFDNLSKMQDWISDTLCRLATGGGFATRQLYSDQEEALFNAMRPIILNGIEDFVTRPDLGDRSILLILQQILEENRRSEKELYADFDKEMPLIFGALLDAVAHGLKKLPSCKLAKMPRMADFALWGMACETAFRPAGTFMAAYEQNRASTVSNVLEGDAVASAVQMLMEKQPVELDGRTEWKGAEKKD